MADEPIIQRQLAHIAIAATDSAAHHPLVRAGRCAESLPEGAGQMGLVSETDFRIARLHASNIPQ